MSTDDDKLERLMQQARTAFEALPPEAQREHRIQQAISFVYGNLKIDSDNPALTRELVEKTVREHYAKKERLDG